MMPQWGISGTIGQLQLGMLQSRRSFESRTDLLEVDGTDETDASHPAVDVAFEAWSSFGLPIGSDTCDKLCSSHFTSTIAATKFEPHTGRILREVTSRLLNARLAEDWIRISAISDSQVADDDINAPSRWNIHAFIRNAFCSLEWLGFQTAFCSLEVFPNSTVENRLEDDVHARFSRIVEGSDAAAFRIGVGVALYVRNVIVLSFHQSAVSTGCHFVRSRY
jgi:hypothetical protein